MCRELNREPVWIAAIKLALTRGRLTVEDVVEEANLVQGRERTVRDVLGTMVERDLLRESRDFDGSGVYLAGEVLHRSAPSPTAANYLSEDGLHRWKRANGD